MNRPSPVYASNESRVWEVCVIESLICQRQSPPDFDQAVVFAHGCDQTRVVGELGIVCSVCELLTPQQLTQIVVGGIEGQG